MEAVILKLADACDEKVASFYNSISCVCINSFHAPVKRAEVDAAFELTRQYGCADIGEFMVQLRDEIVKRFVKRFTQSAGLLDGGMV